MTVEVSDSGFVIVENGSEPNLTVDDEKVSIKFGSHSVEEPVKVEANFVSEPNVPKDAVDDWPEPQQVHSFYVVRYRALEDQSLKGKLDLAEKELQKKNQARMQNVEKIKAERAKRAQVVAQIRSLSVENRQYRSVMDEKRKEMEPLTQALGKLRGSGGGDRGSGICSSEKELNDLIKSLQLRIQHESIPLTEEKQIMREIKLLEGTRPKVIANSAERARIQESMGEKDAIQGQVKLIGVDLDGAWKEKQVINAKLKQLDEEKLVIEKAINNLEEELTAVTEKRDKTFETIRDMRKQREEGNSPFYEYRYLLNKMKALADNKEVDSLKELSETEVDKFMSLWNTNKGFRDDYEKRILSSLDMRQLSKDGRLRNPNEKPLVRVETAAPTPASTEVLIPKASAKQIPKEEPVAAPAKEDEQKGSKTKGGKNTNKIDSENNAEEEEYFVSEKPKEAVKVEVDEKKLKELRREEEIAKRKEAEERKKKMAEKAAAKAAIKAQKEAEKKLKEREKKAKKKAGGAFTALESEESATEVVEEVEEPENVEEKKETPQKTRGRKENTVRQRARPRGLDSLPKAILKRKKGTNYWVWGAASAVAVAIVLLVFVGYNHLS